MEYQKIVTFALYATAYLRYGQDNKISYALRKVHNSFEKQLKKLNDELEEELEGHRIDFCSTDEKGNILKDEKGNYLFSKEAYKSLTKIANEVGKKYEEKRNEVIFEVKTHFIQPPSLLLDLSVAQIEAFAGFIVEEEMAKGLIEKKLEQPVVESK